MCRNKRFWCCSEHFGVSSQVGCWGKNGCHHHIGGVLIAAFLYDHQSVNQVLISGLLADNLKGFPVEWDGEPSRINPGENVTFAAGR